MYPDDMPNYSVQVADRETGKETVVFLEAENTDDARNRAASRGWLVGRVDLDTISEPKPSRSDRAAPAAISLPPHILNSRLWTHPRLTIAEGIFCFFILLACLLLLVAAIAFVGALVYRAVTGNA